MLFRCVLMDYRMKGLIRENFYREGDSEESILADLKSFQWPAGKWQISPSDDEEDYD